MAKVLIDNATISSVQRALGMASLRDRTLLDIEHVALARFCEAVLLSEAVIIPDNYKPNLTPTRKKLLSGDVFHFEALDDSEDEAIGEAVSGLSGIWNDAFHAGSDRSLFSKYFQQVNAFSNFVWERSSSELFLVFRAHGIDKGNPLIEAIMASPADYNLGQELEIIDGDERVPWQQLSAHVRRMLSVMGWIGHQYLWHQIFAAQHELTYMPHPLRDFFSYDFLKRVARGKSSTTAFSAAFDDGIGKFEGTVRESLEELGLVEAATTMVLPGFLPLVVSECSSRQDFMSVLLQMRSESQVVALRTTLQNIDEEMERGNYAPLAQLKREIEAIGRNLLLERGLKTQVVSITPPTTLLGLKVQGDDLSVKLRIPAVLYKQFFVGRRYRAFVKRLMEELTVPSKWGGLKTKLDGWAWLDGEPYPAFYLNR